MTRATLALAALVAVLAVPLGTSAQRLIVVDPGHGGSDPGAVGCGLREAPMALDVSKRLARLLEGAGLRVRLTRSTDTYVSLSGRTTLANSAGATRFVSIHNNAHTSSATGTETFSYTAGSSASHDMRNRIQRAMIRAWMLTDRGSKTANFYVLKYTSMPASLSELAFISRCSPDAELIGDPDARQLAAQAHFNAITAHLGIDTTPPPPPAMDGVIRGVVYEDRGLGEEDTSVRLPGASVSLVETDTPATASEGMAEFSFTLPAGTYTIQAALEGYAPAMRSCVHEGAETWCSIGLTPLAAEADAGTEPAPDAGVGEDPMPVVPSDRPPSSVEGCSASGAGAASGWWMIALGLLFVRRRRAVTLALAGLALLVACTEEPRAVSAPLRDAPAPRARPVEATAAATVATFAALEDDRVLLHEELGGALLSPDAERVALTLPGERGLRIVEVATGAELDLTEAPRAGHAPVWRADGLAIAFRAPDQSSTAVPVHSVTVDGAPIAPFTAAALPHFVERAERIVRVSERGEDVVSPDVEGERFIAPLRSPDGAHVVFLGLHTGLYVHRVRDGRTAALGHGAQPSFSADGQWLVFTRTSDDGHRLTAGDLYLTYLGHDAYPTGQLTDTPDRIEVSPSLDATATRIAYLDDLDGALHLAAIDLFDTGVIDGARDGSAPHFHLPEAPAHTHPHVAADDPWHVTLGH